MQRLLGWHRTTLCRLPYRNDLKDLPAKSVIVVKDLHYCVWNNVLPAINCMAYEHLGFKNLTDEEEKQLFCLYGGLINVLRCPLEYIAEAHATRSRSGTSRCL